MSAKKSSKVVKSISFILVLLAMVIFIGFFATFTNGFTSDFKSFYVENDGEQLLNNVDNVAILKDTEMRFDCKYTFGFLNKKQPKGYNVKVVPNVSQNNDFDFSVDGQLYAFGAEPDLMCAFDIVFYDNYFTLKLTKTMQEVLQTVHSGKTVVAPNNYLKVDYFTLVISSYDGKSVVNIGMHYFIDIDNIGLDKGGIIF